jgi:hypothetical protein
MKENMVMSLCQDFTDTPEHIPNSCDILTDNVMKKERKEYSFLIFTQLF